MKQSLEMTYTCPHMSSLALSIHWHIRETRTSHRCFFRNLGISGGRVLWRIWCFEQWSNCLSFVFFNVWSIWLVGGSGSELFYSSIYWEYIIIPTVTHSIIFQRVNHQPDMFIPTPTWWKKSLHQGLLRSLQASWRLCRRGRSAGKVQRKGAEAPWFLLKILPQKKQWNNTMVLTEIWCHTYYSVK